MKNYLKHKLRGKNPAMIALWVVLIAILIVFFIALFGFVFQYLWNWLMPEIFGLTTITYWQAIGLMIFSKILFGGFNGGDKDKSHCEDYSKKKSSKKDFSKWELYDAYWKEEGEAAYEEYMHRVKNPTPETNTKEEE